MGLIEDFKVGLYEEHLDEVSFLYEQRARYREDPSLRWQDVHELEQRLEAHLDGLFLGGQLALACADATLDLEDPGSLFGTLALYCRLGAAAPIAALVEGAGAQQLAAVQEALCVELLPEQGSLVIEGLASSQPALWARIAGFQGLPLGRELLNVLDKGSSEVVWALGELRYTAAREPLARLARQAGSPLSAAAALALAKLQGPIEACPDGVLLEHALLPLLQGTLRHEQLVVLARGDDSHAARQAITALGLEGDPRSVTVLTERMTASPPMAAACATSLHLLTGAAPLETATVASAQDLDPDLASADSDEAEPEPVLVRRLSQDAAHWQHWLQENPLLETAHLRMGQPLGLATTIEAFTSTALPMPVRRLLGDELRIRTQHSLPLQPELPVSRQRALLAKLPPSAANIGWSYPQSARGEAHGGRL